jgi:hypothetical protein
VIQYAVLSQVEWLVNNIGKGLLVEARVGGEPVTLNYDLPVGIVGLVSDEPQPIVAEGIETIGTGPTAYTQRYRWSLYQGSNVVLVGAGVYVVRVARQNPWAAPITTLIGRWNASPCVHIAGAQVGMLKLIGYENVLVPNTHGIYICDFLLAFNADGWAQGCMARKEIFKVVDEPVLKNDEAGTDTLALTPVGRWNQALNNAGKSIIEDRDVVLSDVGLMFTIALIDGYLTW